MNAKSQLALVGEAFAQFQRGELRAAPFSALAREQTLLRQTLPTPYRVVLDQLLDRVESSALFTDESCSFSQQGLMDHLQVWLDKAAQQLDKP